MSVGSESQHPTAPNGRFWTRAGLFASVLRMLLVIWASHAYLTRAFSDEQEADATVRATLYAGSIQSTIQRHSVVPLLLSRDPILILSLRTGQYQRAEERLASFKEEIGAAKFASEAPAGGVLGAAGGGPRNTGVAARKPLPKSLAPAPTPPLPGK